MTGEVSDEDHNDEKTQSEKDFASRMRVTRLHFCLVCQGAIDKPARLIIRLLFKDANFDKLICESTCYDTVHRGSLLPMSVVYTHSVLFQIQIHLKSMTLLTCESSMSAVYTNSVQFGF